MLCPTRRQLDRLNSFLHLITGLSMNTQHNYEATSASAAGRSENAIDMWERLCEMWDSALQQAQKMGDSNEAARAELTLEMCVRERRRVEALFRVPRA